MIREGLARIQEPRLRRDLGLDLARILRGSGSRRTSSPNGCSDLARPVPQRHPAPALAADPPGDREGPAPGAEPRRRDQVPGGRRAASNGATSRRDSGRQRRARTSRRTIRRSSSSCRRICWPIPRDHASRLLLADTYEKANELPLAVTTYQEAQRLLPDNVLLLVRTIAVLLQAKDYDGARAAARSGRAAEPAQPRLGQAAAAGRCSNRASWQRSRTPWKKMVSRDPNDASSRLNLALIRIQAKKYDEAQKILDDAQGQDAGLDGRCSASRSVSTWSRARPTRRSGSATRSWTKLHNAPAYTLRARSLHPPEAKTI